MVKRYKHDHTGVPITDGETLGEFMIRVGLSELRCRILDNIKSNDASVSLLTSVEPITIDDVKVVERKGVI
jgi:hypothetical protein